jgi:hypothetical protein
MTATYIPVLDSRARLAASSVLMGLTSSLLLQLPHPGASSDEADLAPQRAEHVAALRGRKLARLTGPAPLAAAGGVDPAAGLRVGDPAVLVDRVEDELLPGA